MSECTRGRASLRFDAHPGLTSRLYRDVEIADGDATPPADSLERAAVTYVCYDMSGVTEPCQCATRPESAATSSRAPVREDTVTSPAVAVIGGFVPRRTFGSHTTLFSYFESASSATATATSADPTAAAELCCAICHVSYYCRTPIAAYASFAFLNAGGIGAPVSEAYLVAVTVAAPHRRSRLCRGLLAAAFADVALLVPTMQRVRLHVRTDLPYLRSMYERCGFAVRRHCARYYVASADGRVPAQDAVEMVLAVDAARRRPR